jgi:CheY-like chemotaxis protein
MVHSLIERVFNPYDVEVFFACNGEEALELAAREHPDLILLDFKMPVLNGLEVLGKLRADHSLRDTRVLMITSERAKENVESVVRMGVCGYITKPFSEAALVDRVSRHIPLRPGKKKATQQFPPQQLVDPVLPAKLIQQQPAAFVRQKAPAPEPTARRRKTAREILIVEKKSVRDAAGLEVESVAILSLADKIGQYILLLGTANAYFFSIFLKLLEVGKVRVDFRDHAERLHLENPAEVFSRDESVTILDNQLELLQREDKGKETSTETQRISFHTQRVVRIGGS